MKTEASVHEPRFIEGIELRSSGGESYKSLKVPSSAADVLNIRSVNTNSDNQKEGIDKDADIENFKSLQFKYAQLMNVEVEYVSNFKLYNFIDEWWATKYRYGGSSKSGIDCSSLTGILHQTVYGNNLPRMARDQYNACEKISEQDMREGDLVFFNTRGGVSHVGVYLSGGCFVHASTKLGVTISNLNEEYYRQRFIGGGRFVTK